MRERKRVVVTGIGAVTPMGQGSVGLLEGMTSGRSGIRSITRFDAGRFSSRIAGEVPDFDPLASMDAKRARRLDRFAQFGVAAARQAVQDAGLHFEDEDRDRAGVFIGAALGGGAFAEEQHEIYLREGIRRIKPTLALAVFSGSASCNVAIEFGITGPTSANSDSCTSAAIALGEAFRFIREGETDLFLAGGVECPLAPLIFGAFDLIRAMSTRNDAPEASCRPFDAGRDGFVMAEGAAILVLEEYSHAVRRDAPIYGEILGYGSTNDAHHMTAPLPSGRQAARAMRLAMEDAGLLPEQVGYVNAHATSTPLNDSIETTAIKLALGEAAYTIPVSGTKPMHGHSLGASGAIEAALCMLALRHEYLPPTLNLVQPDPQCDLDYIPHEGRHAPVDYILSNSFGFGGINATLAFGRVAQ
ncbi:MAG TPA: beta-ketoacyl-ACP synthase II [bacterium]|jgi:3-oxoacyl-[acyl-carrier-protein] synthase II|nr:beta-ketoacyl-ACP synthase II [bacterium]